MRLLIKNRYGKLTFSNFLLYQYNSWIPVYSPKIYTPRRYHQFSTIIFPISGGGIPASPLPKLLKSVPYISERHLFDFTEFKFQMETDKMEYRAVIKFLTLEGQTGQQIYDRMKVIYKEECPHYSTIKRWVTEFKRGREFKSQLFRRP